MLDDQMRYQNVGTMYNAVRNDAGEKGTFVFPPALLLMLGNKDPFIGFFVCAGQLLVSVKLFSIDGYFVGEANVTCQRIVPPSEDAARSREYMQVFERWIRMFKLCTDEYNETRDDTTLKFTYSRYLCEVARQPDLESFAKVMAASYPMFIKDDRILVNIFKMEDPEKLGQLLKRYATSLRWETAGDKPANPEYYKPPVERHDPAVRPNTNAEPDASAGNFVRATIIKKGEGEEPAKAPASERSYNKSDFKPRRVSLNPPAVKEPEPQDKPKTETKPELKAEPVNKEEPKKAENVKSQPVNAGKGSDNKKEVSTAMGNTEENAPKRASALEAAVPALKAYNTAIANLKGMGLFHAISFLNGEAFFRSCVAKEADLLHKAGVLNSPDVTEGGAGKNAACIMDGCDNDEILKAISAGAYVFFNNHAPEVLKGRIQKFDISAAGLVIIEEWFDKVGLDIDCDLADAMKPYKGWEAIPEEIFVNNTIMEHYMSDKGIATTVQADDFKWIANYAIPEAPKQQELVPEPPVQAEQHSPAPEVKAEPEPVSVSEPEPVVQSVPENKTEQAAEPVQEKAGTQESVKPAEPEYVQEKEPVKPQVKTPPMGVKAPPIKTPPIKKPPVSNVQRTDKTQDTNTVSEFKKPPVKHPVTETQAVKPIEETKPAEPVNVSEQIKAAEPDTAVSDPVAPVTPEREQPVTPAVKEPEPKNEQTVPQQSSKAKPKYDDLAIRKANADIFDQMMKEQKTMYEKIKASRNNRYSPIQIAYEKALSEKNAYFKGATYCKDVFPRTAEGSPDDFYATPLYKLLYESEMRINELQKKIVKVTRPVTCFMCRTKMEADVSTMIGPDGKVKCSNPNCGHVLTIDFEEE